MPFAPRYEFEKGGHWRFVEHSDQGVHGFEGRYREITPKDRIVQTFEWDGMPAYVVIEGLNQSFAALDRLLATLR